jgi:replicative DNA helicase
LVAAVFSAPRDEIEPGRNVVTPFRVGVSEPIRILSSNAVVERAVLGATFRNNPAHSRVTDFLEAEEFANAVHVRINAACCKVIERAQLTNLVTLKNLFDQDRALPEIGGAQYPWWLAEAAVTITNAEDYGRRIDDLALRRWLIAFREDVISTVLS